MVRLAEARRTEYEPHQPVFWRKALDSKERQRDWFAALLDDPSAICLVLENDGELEGMLIGSVAPAPAVYNPGGLTCTVDDFVVRAPELWAEAGAALLDQLMTKLKDRGAAQIVVVCGHHDAAKRIFLESRDLSIASEWWTTPI